ncbi:hypothetical protein [Flavobacterium sp. IMCC34518]|uniref:hypothetical protein n=1 Tax=Flavobacterium sp. IMCC34518 TaxID=3003623 RepID=UPI0022AC231C|nr:hypothetical protein [Flavobacterium sp. IMCC34518]
MKNKAQNSKPGNLPKEKEEPYTLSDYPESEDIYNKLPKESDVDPEDISKMKEIQKIQPVEKRNEKDFNDDKTGSDLDIPGSELDDIQEEIGNEDEENNYYSLGGDDHNDLDEDLQE